MQLNRSIKRWLRCDPRSMAKMSEMAIMYAFEDALYEEASRSC